jgi:hypothetical protein
LDAEFQNSSANFRSLLTTNYILNSLPVCCCSHRACVKPFLQLCSHHTSADSSLTHVLYRHLSKRIPVCLRSKCASTGKQMQLGHRINDFSHSQLNFPWELFTILGDQDCYATCIEICGKVNMLLGIGDTRFESYPEYRLSLEFQLFSSANKGKFGDSRPVIFPSSRN